MTTQSSHSAHSQRPHRFRSVVASITASALILLAAPIAAADPAVSVEQDQQELMAQLNAARWNPQAYAAEFGVDPGDTLPRPPLAVNPELTAAARFKADEIADHGYFGHQSAVTGLWPNELVRSWGYPLPGEFPDDANNIESLHSGSPSPFHVVGSFIGSASHRYHVLGQGWFGTHTEVGIGRSSAENVWAVQTAYRSGGPVFLTGTVFEDLDGDGIMDAGEGLPGVTVTAGPGSAVTNAGGGYTLQVAPGKHLISAEGPGFSGVASTKVRVGEYNVLADFVSGVSLPVVRDYQLCKGREPTILGTNGHDVIYGTDGPDVIHGLAGKDQIFGLKGDDVICGGGGNDRLYGDGGRDLIIGGRGNDKVLGSLGDDRLKGGAATDIIHGGNGTDSCQSGETLVACP